jgi:hypothetical protein
MLDFLSTSTCLFFSLVSILYTRGQPAR